MAELREQLKTLWERFSPRQRWLIMGSALLLFISVLAASYWVGGKPQYVPLFAEMESKDAGDVAAADEADDEEEDYRVGIEIDELKGFRNWSVHCLLPKFKMFVSRSEWVVE